MKILGYRTYNQIFAAWMEDAVHDIKAEAVRLVSGPLLKVSSGQLVNSFHTRVLQNGHLGVVWNDAPHAATWEFQGVDYKGAAKANKPTQIIKRGALGNRSDMGIKWRTMNYKRTKNKKPVHFLWTATRNEMTGNRGRGRYATLGYEVGYLIARRYVDMLKQKYAGNVLEIWHLD